MDSITIKVKKTNKPISSGASIYVLSFNADLWSPPSGLAPGLAAGLYPGLAAGLATSIESKEFFSFKGLGQFFGILSKQG